MIERATGIILRTRLLTETSLIVQWLTPDGGRIATVAKGARRAKSPFRGKLDLFYSADFSYVRSRRSDLHTLREMTLRETHSALRMDLSRLQQASYAAKLIEQTTETETPLPEVYQLLDGFVEHLTRQPPQPLGVFAFEMKLLTILGQSPNRTDSSLTAGARQILERTVILDWAALACLAPSAEQNRELQQFLHGFMIFHLGRIPSGRAGALAGAEGGGPRG